MKLGAERKKIIVLAGLLVVALLVFVLNSGSSSGDSRGAAATSPRPVPAAAANGLPSPVGPDASAASSARARTSAEFRPHVGTKRGQPRPDPMGIDPTLRLDVIARLQKVDVTGTHRSLFDFGQAPPPPKPDDPKTAAAKPKVPSPIVPIQPSQTANNKPAVPSKPTAPPVPLKFYGYVNPAASQKRAFFMEGDEIHVVSEGELVKRRYKIVRIGVNSVIVEDTQFPGSQQTLPLEEQPG